MKHTAVFRAISVATITSLALVAAGTAASAAPAEATLTIGTAGVLTLPANDGVRDKTTVTIASDVGTIVELKLRPAGQPDGPIIGSVELTDEALTKTFDLAATGLAAGKYDLLATPSAGAPKTTPVTVGSGVATTASIALSAGTIFTWSKATPRSTTATVSAKDETGLTVPFTGTVKAAVGGKTVTANVKSTTDAAAKTSAFAVGKFKPGTGKVTATLKGVGSATASADATLKVLQTAVTKVTLKSSVATVFPAKDKYNDTVKLTVTPKTTTGKAFKSTGKVTITRNGKTVKSWKITSSKAKSVTWNGKVKGKIVPGTYTVKVSLKGPEGATKTTTKKIKVDKGKLVTKKQSVTYKAGKIFKSFSRYDSSSLCYTNWAKVNDFRCFAGTAEGPGTLAVLSQGTVTVPKAVVSAQKYGKATAKVTMNVVAKSGYSEWGYDVVKFGGAKGGALKKGKNTGGALKLPATSKKLHLIFGLEEYATLGADTIKVDYTYKVMKR